MKEEITYEDFAKLDIRIGQIISAKQIEGADKLIECTVDFGEELGERTIVSGIKEWFDPEELVGKKLPYIINLAPRKLRGVVSNGMLLAASTEIDGDRSIVLIEPSEDIPAGTVLG